jgi:succinate dehydrogenase flavin-adding protein (antitoxin of CptAB toxin-antitoxin module)
VQALRFADYSSMRDKLEQLRTMVESRRGTIVKSDLDMETTLQQESLTSLLDCNDSDLWETCISCDSLICDVNGKHPSPIVIVQIRDSLSQRWINYGKTEMIEVSLIHNLIIKSCF